jgi:hypothetical protein
MDLLILLKGTNAVHCDNYTKNRDTVWRQSLEWHCAILGDTYKAVGFKEAI